MSPRSEEMRQRALRWLAAARSSRDAGFFDVAISSAYYAMLYAARATREEDQHAKTHSRTWNRSRRAAASIATSPRRRDTQPLRERADHDASELTRDEAAELIELAEPFVAALGDLVGG